MNGNGSLSVNQRKNTRLNDYFAVVGLDPEDELRVASDGLTQYSLCDSQRNFDPNTHPVRVKYVAQVLHRFPTIDHDDNPFPANLSLFCLPGGLKLKLNEEIPTFFAFVHTRANGQHMYGFCLTFYERLDEETRSELQEDCDRWEYLYRGKCDDSSTAPPLDHDTEVYSPKCLCLLSSWPYFDSYREWLTNLFLMSLSPSEIPLERYICNFMLEVPNALPGRTEVRYRMGVSELKFSSPPPNKPIAWHALPFDILFQCLDDENVISVFESILLERSVLFKSSQLFLLTAVAEVLTTLLYPMCWTHVYIPVLPEPLIGVLGAPMPFIVGIHVDWGANDGEGKCLDVPSHVIQVDLDRNKVYMGKLPATQLPSKRRAKLLGALSESVAISMCRESRTLVIENADLAFSMAVRPCYLKEGDGIIPEEPPNWDPVREAFLRLFVALLRGYHRYLVFPTKADPSPKEPFLHQLFVERQDSDYKSFMGALVTTQAFQNFIDARTQPDPDDLDVRLFDEGIEAKRNRSKLSMIKRDTGFLLTDEYSQLKTIFALTPDDSGLDGIDVRPAVPGTFPTLNEELYSIPRDVPGIRGKFERHDMDPSLTGKKRRTSRIRSSVHLPMTNVKDDIASKLTPEEAIYGVFIVGFCAAIGRDPPRPEALEKGLFTTNTSFSSPVNPPRISAFSTESNFESPSRFRTGSADLQPASISLVPVHKIFSRTKLYSSESGIAGRNFSEFQVVPNNKVTFNPIPPNSSVFLNNGSSDSDTPKQLSPLGAKKVELKRRDTTSFENCMRVPTSTGREFGRYPPLPPPPSLNPMLSQKKSVKAKNAMRQQYKTDYGHVYAFAVSSLLYGRQSGPFLELLKACISNNGQLDNSQLSSGLHKLVPQALFLSHRHRSPSFPQEGASPKLASLAKHGDVNIREDRLVSAKLALTVGFVVVEMMQKRRMGVEESIYRALIDACIRCGDAERAIAVVEMMMTAGIRPDAAINNCLIDAFSMDKTMCAGNPFDLLDWSKLQSKSGLSLLNNSKPKGPEQSPVIVETVPSESKSIFRKIMNRMGNNGSDSKIPKSGPNSIKKVSSTGEKEGVESSQPQNERGELLRLQVKLGEQLLGILFPNLRIDTESETCPECHRKISSFEIRTGWERNPNVYTTKCPHGAQCGEGIGQGARKFVARFNVHSSSEDWLGSTGPGTVLWCEYLSPWVLRKELHTMLKDYGVGFLCSPEFRSASSTNSTIFWNIIVHLRQNNLPITWILAGPFATSVLSPVLLS